MNLRDLFAQFIGAGLLVVALSAAADASSSEQQLDTIIAEHWDYLMREDPITATTVGVNSYNDRLPSVAQTDQLRRLEAEQSFLRRTKDIDRETLSVDGRINADIFEWLLEDSIQSYELNLSRIPFNTFSGFFMGALTASDNVTMSTAQDYEDYIARMSAIPRYFRENMDNMRDGTKTGFVLPQIVIDGVLPTIEAQIKSDPESSSFFKPFQDMSDRLSAAQREKLSRRGRATIRDSVMPTCGRYNPRSLVRLTLLRCRWPSKLP